MAPLTRKRNANKAAVETPQTDKQRYEKEQADHSQIKGIENGNRYGCIRFDKDGALEYRETEEADFGKTNSGACNGLKRLTLHANRASGLPPLD